MPREIKSGEEFERYLEGARECRVLERGERTKLKLRTGEGLLTYVTDKKEADRLLRHVKVKVVKL